MGNVQTRHMDAKGMAHRRGSIYWNFRYSTMRRKDANTMMVFNSKISIKEWLEFLDLQQYESNFSMYNCVEDILDLDDADLRLKGVRDPEHRSKMLSSLVRVQAKRRISMNIDDVSKQISPTLQRRKNSCPPMYLAECTSLFDTQQSLKRNSYQRGTLTPNAKSPVDKKRFTFDETDTIYEELKPRDNNSDNPSNDSDTKIEDITMDNDSMNSGSFNQPTSLMGSILPPTNEQQEALALKKALEWELSLDSRDLRSHAWYHGPLPRQRAEEIVQREGDFLIRDCTSQPHNYVLTCRSNGAVLHFVINKILVQPETVYERIQYQFEEDAFDAIPDLITFYVGSGKPISLASGALIQYPCNRNYPLSFYGHKIVGNQLHSQMLAGLRGPSPLNSPLAANAGFRFGGMTCSGIGQQQQMHGMLQHQQSLPTSIGQPIMQQQSPMSSPPRGKLNTAPRLPSKKQRSQSLTPAQAIVVSNMKNAEAGNSADGVIQSSTGMDAIVSSGSMNQLNQANGQGYRPDIRRFSQFEKSNSICGSPNETQLHSHLENLNMHGKIPTNGFQTIARCTANDMVDNHIKFTTHSLPRPATNNFRNNLNRTSSLARDFNADSSASMFSSLEISKIPELPEKPPSPPPKPNRNAGQTGSLSRPNKEPSGLEQQYPLQRQGGMAGIYQLSGSDSGNGSGDSMPGDMNEFIMHRGVIIKNPRFMTTSMSSVTLKSLSEFDVEAAEDQLFTLEIPSFKGTSKFDVENFSTLLLPSCENNPLDGDALNTFKIMLLETGPKMLAEHITRIDIGLLIEEPNSEPESESNNYNNIFDYSGLEMLTLPQGKIFRKDIVERTQCLKLMVAVTILTCQTDLDRAEILSKWIQVAVETKTALGNLFGFSTIMLGLCMPQIQKLTSAWHLLRQKYTDDAFMFEAKLRPTLTSMNECSNPQAPNTTVPHVLLYALLMDRPVFDILNFNSTTEKSSLYNMCITSWESRADDFGMYINYAHLDSSRSFLNNLEMYRKNSKIILEESISRLDELLSDAFRTEFHIKFLWGSKGATATAEDRHSKLEKVLALMADRFCNPDNGTTTTA
ncbi:breast cancer anti-estrogen resistance protein 3 homolog isoform X1 [Lucilia cuprina]|uniref:breast cancer anti-estrogen resistance protein 3 homolog isoform X1 n=3 Tax=Lucilia cuprina TaxID=7375 RepID=UPI001F059CFC|nr:breast cancer anti-estrogen resistance protein 3 homolog isoform X1 [Lucilia cuprina]